MLLSQQEPQRRLLVGVNAISRFVVIEKPEGFVCVCVCVRGLGEGGLMTASC